MRDLKCCDLEEGGERGLTNVTLGGKTWPRRQKSSM